MKMAEIIIGALIAAALFAGGDIHGAGDENDGAGRIR